MTPPSVFRVTLKDWSSVRVRLPVVLVIFGQALVVKFDSAWVEPELMPVMR